MNQLVFKYALAVSLASIILKLIVFYTGLQFSTLGEYSTYFVFLFILIAIYFGMRQAKIKNTNKQSLRESINVGCKIAALNSLVMSVFIYVYYSFIDKGYFTEKIRKTLILMIENGNTIDQMKEYYLTARLLLFAPDKVASFTLFGYLFIGCFYAVISGFVLRKNSLSGI